MVESFNNSFNDEITEPEPFDKLYNGDSLIIEQSSDIEIQNQLKCQIKSIKKESITKENMIDSFRDIVKKHHDIKKILNIALIFFFSQPIQNEQINSNIKQKRDLEYQYIYQVESIRDLKLIFSDEKLSSINFFVIVENDLLDNLLSIQSEFSWKIEGIFVYLDSQSINSIPQIQHPFLKGYFNNFETLSKAIEFQHAELRDNQMFYQQGFNFRDQTQEKQYLEITFLFNLFDQKNLDDDIEDQKYDLIAYVEDYIEQNKDYINLDSDLLKKDKKQFEKDIAKNEFDPISWYTKESFFYQMINQTFRYRNHWGIFLLRYAIKELQKVLQCKQKQIDIENYPDILYRGSYLPSKLSNLFSEWSEDSQKILKTPLMLLGFTSTSSKEAVAMKFCTKQQKDQKKLLIEIHVDKTKCENLPVPLSTSEEEYLFQLNSSFLFVTNIIQDEKDKDLIRVQTKIAKPEDVLQNFHKESKTYNDELKKKYLEPRYKNVALILSSFFTYFFANVTLPYLKSKKYGNEKQDIQRKILMAQAYYRLNEIDNCEIQSKEVLDYMDKICHQNKQDYALALYQLGSVQNDKTEYAKSLETFKKCLDLLQKKFPDDRQIGASYNQIGTVFRNLGDYERAEKFLNKAIETKKYLYKGNLNHISFRPTLNNLAYIYMEQGEEKNAKYLQILTDLNNGNQQNKQKKQEVIQAITMIRLARACLKTQDIERAKSSIQEAQKLFSKYKELDMYYDPFYEAEMLNTFGQIYYETKEYVKAKEYFKNAAEIYNINGIERMMIVVNLYRKYSEVLLKEIDQITLNQSEYLQSEVDKKLNESQEFLEKSNQIKQELDTILKDFGSYLEEQSPGCPSELEQKSENQLR